MKKLLRLLCVIFSAFIALFAVACNAAETDGSSGGTGTPSGGNASGGSSGGGFVTTAGDESDNLSGDITATTTETEIANAVTYDFDALKENTEIPEGATVVNGSEETYTITTAGDYVLSGTFSAGVTVKKNSGNVHIYLNNATITCDSDSALAIKAGNNVTVTVVDETTSTITSSYKNGLNSNGDVYINGGGVLNVESTAKNGIKVDSALVITGATINVTAVNYAISAFNVNAKDCTINVTTANDGEAKDGIHAEIEDPETEEDISSIVWTADDGYVILNNVTYTASVEGDGIQADTFVYINGGTYDISTTAKFVAYSAANIEEYGLEDDDFRYKYNSSTKIYEKQASDGNINYNSSYYYAMIQSSKGIKVGEIDYELVDSDDNVIASGEITSGNYYILIEGGTFKINSADDAIHANSGSVTVNGGTFDIATYDDGITADYLTKINGGTITVSESYEGIEGSYVEINGGTIKMYCDDDGINAASDYNVTEYIKITGGDVYVNAQGDGIDSNGNITISGGKVFVDGPTGSGDASIDADGKILINGGYVVAVGSSGMLQEAIPDTSSSQYTIVYAGSTIAAGTTLTLKDSSGKTVVSFKTGKTAQSAVISAPEISTGSYTLYAENNALATFTVSSKVTTYGVNGSMGGGNMGGPNGGGMQGGPSGMGGRRP